MLCYMALVVVPVGLVILVMATKFGGLRAPRAMDQAQMARLLATGHGFVTSVVRPFGLTVYEGKPYPPDLYNAPLQPFLLSFILTGNSGQDRTVAVFGAGLWLVAIWLTFLIAKKWFGNRTAGLAALLYGCCVMALMASVEGLPVPLLANAVLLVSLLAVPAAMQSNEIDTIPISWRIPLAGVVCALATLTHYLFVLLALAVAVYYLLTAERKWAALWRFGAGYVLMAAPWLIRNAILTGSPVFSLYGYELLTGLRQYPGATLWRGLEHVGNPFWYALLHPVGTGQKFLANLWHLRAAFLGVLEPIACLLFLAAWFNLKRGAGWRWLVKLTTGSLVIGIAGMCLLRPEPELLLAWAPVMAIVAAAQLNDWVALAITPERMAPTMVFDEDLAFPGEKPGFFYRINTTKIRSAVARTVVYGTITGVAAFPMLYFLFGQSSPSVAGWENRIQTTQRLLPANGVIMSDNPEFVAWHFRRTAVLLCRQEPEVNWVEQKLDPISAFLVSTSLLSGPEIGISPWWKWIIVPRGIYRRFAVVPGMSPDTTLRVRDSQFPVANANDSTLSADGRVQLGTEMLASKRYREAAEQFDLALRDDPANVDALLGLWQVNASFRDANLLALVDVALAVNPDNPTGAQTIERATTLLNQARVVHPRDPWLLLQAATMEARRQNWNQVNLLLETLAKQSPPFLSSKLLLANLYLQQGQLTDAARVVEELQAESPNDASVLIAVGRLREGQQNIPAALEAYARAQQLRPQWPLPYLRAGTLCLTAQRYPEAITNFKKYTELASDSFAGQLGLASAYEGAGQVQNAVDTYDQMLRRWPDQIIIINNLANLLATSGTDLPRAERLARQLDKAQPPRAPMLDTQAWVSHLAGHQDEALRLIQQAAALAPTEGIIQYHLGKILLATGKTDLARQALQKALVLTLPSAQENDARKLLAQ
jgi:tetratricopeptide (TPR) repeat protein